MEFILGCNYWASDSGTDMWRTFNENAVNDDLRILSGHGVKHIRVFPNWRDFQPVIPRMKGGMTVAGYCMEGEREKTNPYYIDDVMMRRFSRFLDLCEGYGIKVIVGLITGWMSGRMFVPPVLYGKNIINDPLSQYFQKLFIKGFVSEFKNSSTVIAWDLGNECNCMSPTDRIGALNWTSMIANAIRAEDDTRPVISGMHSLEVEDNATWRVEDQAMFTDILTTHPYPFWGRNTKIDKTLSLRTTMHATAETKFYSEIGKAPCLAEEIGRMGPMVCSDEKAADFLRLNLFSLWANNSAGVMWWCANDQTELESYPYAENMIELELGMIDKKRSPKPVLAEMKKFSEFLEGLDFEIPKAKTDAVCLLTEGQNQWGVGYMTYILLKESGITPSFAYANDSVPESKLYIMPSITNWEVMKKRNYEELKRRVYEGADLYISLDNGFISEFTQLTGLKVEDSYECTETESFEFCGEEFTFTRKRNYILTARGAEVIAFDKKGNIAIAVNNYGKGHVYVANFPIESDLLGRHDAFEEGVYHIYKRLFADHAKGRPMRIDEPKLAVTYHESGDKMIAVIINHSDKICETKYELESGWSIKETLYGNVGKINPYDACVLELKMEG